jgi:hypothetical protein
LFGLSFTESVLAQTSAEPLAFAQRLVFPSSAAFDGPVSGQYQIDVVRFRIRWPLFLDGKRTVLLPGVSYEHLDVGIRGPFASRLEHGSRRNSELSLHAPMAELGLAHRIDRRWFTMGTFSAGLSSDFVGQHSHDDWAIIARLLVLYRVGSKLTLGIGATYDRSTGNLSFIPLGIVKWSPSSRWLTSILLPRVALVSYRTSSWLSSGVRAELDFSRYHLDESRYGANHLYLRYLAVMLGPVLTFSTNRFVHLDLFTGCSLRWLGAFVHEGPMGADVHFNSKGPLQQVLLSPAAFFSARLWIGDEGWPGS